MRVIRPRFAFHTGHVTVGGSICIELLTSSGWCAARPRAPALARPRVGGGATPRAHPHPQPSPAMQSQIGRQAGRQAGRRLPPSRPLCLLVRLRDLRAARGCGVQAGRHISLCVYGAGRPPTRWSRCSCSSARSSWRARRGSTRRSPTGPIMSRRRAMPSAAWRCSTGGRCEPTRYTILVRPPGPRWDLEPSCLVFCV